MAIAKIASHFIESYWNWVMGASRMARQTSKVNRRQFIQSSTAAAATAIVAPAVVTGQKSDSKLLVGNDAAKFEVQHDFFQLPAGYSWQTTHNVAVDKAGLIYVIHEGQAKLKEHPSIFVFDAGGKFVRSFGQQYQGGGHGLEVREEGGQEFLYVTAYQHLKLFAKLDLKGEVVWEKYAPMSSEKYAEGEDTDRKKVWGRNRFMPTNFAFAPDGGFYLADGYGAWCIHRYDRDVKWISSFGKPGQGDGQFRLPHGVWWDDRGGRDGSVVVADRVNGRLQWFTADGEHKATKDGFILPANVDTWGSEMLVPDLSARITLLDGNNDVLTQLGEDPEWRKEVLKDSFKLRSKPAGWRAGRFLHPHDACYDHDGNIIVAEWVATGRVTKLTRVS